MVICIEHQRAVLGWPLREEGIYHRLHFLRWLLKLSLSHESALSAYRIGNARSAFHISQPSVGLVLIRKLWRLGDSEKIEPIPEPKGSHLPWNSGSFWSTLFTWQDATCKQKKIRIRKGLRLDLKFSFCWLGIVGQEFSDFRKRGCAGWFV